MMSFRITVTRGGVTKEYSTGALPLSLAREELLKIASFEASVAEDGDYLIRRFKPSLNALKINDTIYKIKAI